MDCATSILLAVIFLISTIVILNWLFPSWDYWTSRGIPSAPSSLPVISKTLSIFRSQENFLTICKSIYDANRGRSMVGFYNAKQPCLLLRDPELVKTVLQSSFKNFQHNEKTMDVDVDPLIARDIFFIRGQDWKDSRADFVSTFSSKRLKNMAQAIASVCQKLENHLEEKIRNKNYLELEAKFLFSRYTTEVSAITVFSMEGNSFADDYRGTFLESMKMTIDSSRIKVFKRILTYFLPPLRIFIKNNMVPSQVDKFFRRVVKEVENVRRKDGVERNDVLQHMLDLERDRNIPRADLLAHAFSFFLDSYESSSLTLSFMVYELAKHPEVQNELRREIESVLEKHEGQMTYEAINELFYVEQVINETMRLFPPGAVLSKVCAEKYRLEGSDGLSLDIEPDTTIAIPVMGLHMDPEIWKNPEEFNPERFRKGNDEGRHKFAYLPFGAGPRACPGIRLAIMQIKTAIATIVRNYRIEVSAKMKEPLYIYPGYLGGNITALGGFWIRLHPL